MVLKGNINLAMSVLTTTLSLLFGGGTALLNFLLQIVSIKDTMFHDVDSITVFCICNVHQVHKLFKTQMKFALSR